jgi:hypothetical protein
MLLAAMLVHQFLLMGPDLEKARVLYLPTLGFALLFAAGLRALRPRTAVAVAGLMIVGQVAALEHNLRIWRSVAELADRSCHQAAQLEQAAPHPLVISDVPNVVDGVYFLHSGLRNCVEWAAGKPLPEAFPNDVLPDDPPGDALVWNKSRREFAIKRAGSSQ